MITFLISPQSQKRLATKWALLSVLQTLTTSC